MVFMGTTIRYYFQKTGHHLSHPDLTPSDFSIFLNKNLTSFEEMLPALKRSRSLLNLFRLVYTKICISEYKYKISIYFCVIIPHPLCAGNGWTLHCTSCHQPRQKFNFFDCFQALLNGFSYFTLNHQFDRSVFFTQSKWRTLLRSKKERLKGRDRVLFPNFF